MIRCFQVRTNGEFLQRFWLASQVPQWKSSHLPLQTVLRAQTFGALGKASQRLQPHLYELLVIVPSQANKSFTTLPSLLPL